MGLIKAEQTDPGHSSVALAFLSIAALNQGICIYMYVIHNNKSERIE